MAETDHTNGAPSNTAEGWFDLGYLTHDSSRGDMVASMRGTAGDIVGRYRLIERLGEGGFGVVWRAEQVEPIQRELALKLIKLGMDSSEVIARFEAESQALAMMDHPNIAAVLDAGTCPDGRPHFAMELVRGEPITTYCDSRSLSIRERIQLFIPVCKAVQHAHQKGILHRDLKPSNILVAEIDGRPVPKVIDFGIAKAIGAPSEAFSLTHRDSHFQTRVGMILGTFQYMSPEQAGTVPDVDTRSDIYSLGVILYEMLTGRPPIEQYHVAYDEMLRRIRHEVAPKPSSLIAQSTPELQKVASFRKSDPVRLRRMLRGDLDWLLLKALEKDRRRRYPTATAFAADLERFLKAEPISAVAPTWGYQFTRFARRNRVGFSATLVVLFTLISATIVSLWQANEAQKSRGKADRSRIEAEKNIDRARDAVEVYLNHVKADPRLAGEDFQKLRHELLRSALPFYEEMAKANSTSSSSDDQIWAFGRLADLHLELGNDSQAIEALREWIGLSDDLLEKAIGSADEPEIRRELIDRHHQLISLLSHEEDAEEILQLQQRSESLSEN